MIDLTPIDIRKKKGDFPRAVRGYRVEDVDLFLDLAADRLEEVVNALMRLEERTRQLEEQVRLFREREQALTDALVSAQEMRDEVRRQASKEADLLRREAEAEAERIRAAALRTIEKEEDVLRRLRARRAQFLHTYRTFLERELAELSVMAESVGAGREFEELKESARVGAGAEGAPAARESGPREAANREVGVRKSGLQEAAPMHPHPPSPVEPWSPARGEDEP